MDNSEFGAHFEQISVREYSGFFFTLPERDIGRSDVKIYVEYGVAAEMGRVLYNVWAQLDEQSIRAHIMTNVASVQADINIVDAIVSDINLSEEFHETLGHFIEHFDR